MAFLAPLAAPMMVASAGISAVGSIMQGQSQAGASRYNAEVAQQNATIAEQQGEAAAEQQSVAARRKIGSMVANYGASGVDGASGSALDVLADSARMAALDNLTVKYNYKLKAMGYQNQAALDQSNAKNSETSGALGGVGAGLRGLGAAIPMFSGGAAGTFGSGKGIDVSSNQA